MSTLVDPVQAVAGSEPPCEPDTELSLGVGGEEYRNRLRPRNQLKHPFAMLSKLTSKNVPTTSRQAMSDPEEGTHWTDAIQAEYQSLLDHGVFEPIEHQEQRDTRLGWWREDCVKSKASTTATHTLLWRRS